MKKISLVLFLVLLSFWGFSQNSEIENCLLWEISGNDLATPSYVFGTVHIIPEADFFFFDEWIDKFESCDFLILEADIKIGFFKQLSFLKKMKLPKDSLISDYMTEDEFIAFTSYMNDTLRVSASKYNLSLKYIPFFTHSLLLDDAISGNKIYYEKYLTSLAKSNKMKVIGLETVDYQLSLIEDISIKDQIPMFLFDYSKVMQADLKKEYRKVLDLYIAQNLNQISVIEEEENIDTSFYQKFIINRNTNWIPIIEDYIHKKSSFIAVGAGHLPGEYGVLKLLEEKGYTVKPVCSNSQ